MTDDRWRDTYDSWKLASPYDGDEPEPQSDPGECRACRGSGVIVYRGSRQCPGPLPDPAPRGWYEATCPNCGGASEIVIEDDAP